jgi:hypothetical protein
VEDGLADIPKDEGRVIFEFEVVFRRRGKFIPDSMGIKIKLL